MNQDTLNIFLLLLLIVITTCVCLVTFYAVQALRTINEITQSLKNKVQLKALATIPALLVALVSKFRKRG